jgi:hypothetical protein
MITQEQKDIITDFFAHTVKYNSVRGMDISRDIPDLGKVVSIEADDDDIIFGTIAIRELGTFEISDLIDSELLALISFIQELDVLRRSVQEACERALPDNPNITVCFDWETDKQTRFLFVNNCPKCDYGQQYKLLRAALTPLGYLVKRDPTDSSVAYITKYKAAYLAKSRFDKLLYTIIHFE